MLTGRKRFRANKGRNHKGWKAEKGSVPIRAGITKAERQKRSRKMKPMATSSAQVAPVSPRAVVPRMPTPSSPKMRDAERSDRQRSPRRSRSHQLSIGSNHSDSIVVADSQSPRSTVTSGDDRESRLRHHRRGDSSNQSNGRGPNGRALRYASSAKCCK